MVETNRLEPNVVQHYDDDPEDLETILLEQTFENIEDSFDIIEVDSNSETDPNDKIKDILDSMHLTINDILMKTIKAFNQTPENNNNLNETYLLKMEIIDISKRMEFLNKKMKLMFNFVSLLFCINIFCFLKSTFCPDIVAQFLQ
ncbi:unnamed protein product [Ceutorhynchus assimilis]|uniref:Uncharacterized protein n=1 Tax=Ceutorhynchus assimilis TaxID=467358 RepID=A0A9N9MPL3_9CUCU|nr:unnamed protein product [Ceutorhynchus assimilis]